MNVLAPDRLLVTLPGPALRQLWRDSDGIARWYRITPASAPNLVETSMKGISDDR